MDPNELANKAEQERLARLEKLKELVEKANNQPSVEIPFTQPDEDLGLEGIDFSTNADPDKSHQIYYQIQNILKNNLPKGSDSATKELRAIIREEKNIFLNRGKFKNAYGIRGSDGRMTFIEPFLSEALQISLNWVANGAQPFDLYQSFLDRNTELGYYN
ncbi:hypothetical protein [Mucilaginibacter sp. 44-25]|uniref:hypothetical protein n=1 Tax=Mucilaginibacter sp. 44-25 TaxID=1895794 RepID=UPI00095D99AF|nr:hypothetical protein [Mucilaginibacter sp. 44-25]OJW13444.1 MAG: hypothetical protein BGO48_01425 [Mucilaginibacter sp. 44-25]